MYLSLVVSGRVEVAEGGGGLALVVLLLFVCDARPQSQHAPLRLRDRLGVPRVRVELGFVCL